MEEVPCSDSGGSRRNSESEEMAFGPADQPQVVTSKAKQKGNKAKESKVQTLSVDFDALLPHIGEMGRYQMVLYLLMCIPATLPAAFLAFNQVFLSASPMHWCHIDELVSANLSVEHIKSLGIPYENPKHGIYDRCLQYDVNFTQIYEENGSKWPTKADENWPKAPCKNGWDYDHSEYKDSLVTEVCEIINSNYSNSMHLAVKFALGQASLD